MKLHVPILLSLAAFPLLVACGSETPVDPQATVKAALETADAKALKSGLAKYPELLNARLMPWDMTPLQVAAQRGLTDLAQVCLDAKADVNLPGGPKGATAMFFLMGRYPFQEDLFHSLIDAGAEVDTVLSDGTDLLMAAAANSSTPKSIFFFLANLGLKADAKASDGMTALHWAITSQNAAAASVLLLAGADQNAQVVGMTALDIAMAADGPPDDLEAEKLAFLNQHNLIGKDFMGVMDVLINQQVSVAHLGAVNVVEAWFQAVANEDAEAASKLGTAEWAAHELDWKPSFTNAFFQGGSKVKAHEIRLSKKNEDGNFVVKVRATLLREDGYEDGEGMTFTLKPDDSSWLIIDLK